MPRKIKVPGLKSRASTPKPRNKPGRSVAQIIKGRGK